MDAYTYKNAIYVIVGEIDDILAIEPRPNPENETRYINRDVFKAAAQPAPIERAEATDSNKMPSEKNQKQIRKESERNQEGISLESEKDHKKDAGVSGVSTETLETKPKQARKLHPNSLAALAGARELVAKDALDVMREHWAIVQWMDLHFGLEKLERRKKSFPRRLQGKLNRAFGRERSLSFYRNLVFYYSAYKRQIAVPIWWLRFEHFLERNLFIHLMD